MNKKVDLHSHSTASDGSLTPQQLLAQAQAVGIEIFAITDHDTMAGYLAVKNDPLHTDFTLIAGVEISAYHQLGGSFGKQESRLQGVHILGLDIQDTAAMQTALRTLQESRAARGRAMTEKLGQIFPEVGFARLWQTALARAGGNTQSLGRLHLAQALMDLGLIDGMQQAFDRYLGDNKAAYVALQSLTMAQAVALIHACGGVAVLAHPTRYGLSATRVRRLIADFALMGGDGCELASKGESFADQQLVHKSIAAYRLLVSIGSDFHGVAMPWRKLGQTPTPLPGQVGIWTKFASGG